MEELAKEIDAILERKPPPKRAYGHALAITEENSRRIFGMTLWELFHTIAHKFGYEVPDEKPPKLPE